MVSHRVLLLGGHGKVSMKLTPLLLAKNWHVTSVIRNPDHEQDILKLGQGQPGKLDTLVESLEEVTSPEVSDAVLQKVKPDIVIWSAGAGGKGGPSRTFAVDRDAASHYITSSVKNPNVEKFLMVSYIGSRHARPPWWSDDDWKDAQHINTEVLANYFKAKVEADEHLAALAKKRADDGDKSFQAINLRPGTLSDDPGSGLVSLGKTSSRGKVSREDVASVAAELLERIDTRGWYDLLQGEQKIPEAVEQLVKEGFDGILGEDTARIYARAQQ